MGLAASVIHIGMVLGVGYVSSDGAYESMVRQINDMPVAEPEFLDMFSQAILVGQRQSVHLPELITGISRHSLRTIARNPFWHENSRFYHNTLREEHQQKSPSWPKMSVMQLIAAAEGDTDEILAIVSQELCTKLERRLQAATGSIQASQTLLNLGIDSPVAVEVRPWFVRELDVGFPMLKILGAGSIHDLAVRHWHDLHREPKTATATTPGDQTFHFSIIVIFFYSATTTPDEWTPFSCSRPVRSPAPGGIVFLIGKISLGNIKCGRVQFTVEPHSLLSGF